MNNLSFKEQLFLHLDGIVIIPILSIFNKVGILKYIINKEEFTLNELSNHFDINKAYLNVLLRSLLSSGLLYIDEEQLFQENKKYYSREKLKFFYTFSKELDNFYLLSKQYINFEDSYNDRSLESNLFINCSNFILGLKDKILNNNLNIHLYYYFEGFLIGPLFSYIGYLRMLPLNDQNIFNDIIKDILIKHEYIDSNDNFTEKGNFFFKRLASYGVTTSYLETLSNLDNILINNSNIVWERDSRGYEIHVNRSMNVWGSGGAHKYYFNKIDNIIINIFNADIDKQPVGIVDIGCGDGTFLKHCYELITTKTLRKNFLDSHPLILIGADINKAARISSRYTLNKKNINNIIVKGNISDPGELNKLLLNEYNLKLNDFINTRTFLDHNRIYSSPNELKNYNIKTTGAFCYKGKLITSNQITNNLIEHFSNWKQYSDKFGIIILELHTINPLIAHNNRGKTLACSYDCTHGLSDQYLIEYDIFLKCAKEANLNLVKESELFPNSTMATISINHFK